MVLFLGGLKMKCLSCGIPFHPSDILVMEEWEMPVCDVCDAEEYHFQVDYDGEEDFYEFLNKEIWKKEKICNTCIRGQYELVSLKFGNPVKAAVVCSTCKVEDKMAVYIRFV